MKTPPPANQQNAPSSSSSLHRFVLPGRCWVCFFEAVCCGRALTVALSLALSPLSHSVFNICPIGRCLSQPFSTRPGSQRHQPHQKTPLISTAALLFISVAPAQTGPRIPQPVSRHREGSGGGGGRTSNCGCGTDLANT